MRETDVQQIVEKLKRAYPKYEISFLATQQRGGRYLITVKGFDAAGDIDDWSVDVVYPVFKGMQELLEQQEDALKYVRLLFIRDNQFMLHSPDVGCGSAFKKMEKPLYVECYGYCENQYYVGECLDIADVLAYLTTMSVCF